MTKQLKEISRDVMTLSSAGWSRKWGWDLLSLVMTAVGSVLTARRLLGDFKPHAVVTFGGYPGFAPSLAARLIGSAVVMIEQNSIPGLANRLIYPLAKCVILNYAYTRKIFRRGIVIGNPVNPRIGKVDRKSAMKRFGLDPRKRTVLIFGGSQGASGLNKVVLLALEKMKEFNLLWSCGRKNYDNLRRAPEVLKCKHVKLFPFIEEMAYAWRAADVVVSRSGASTISEMKAAKIPGVLVPFPQASENHQYFNAMEMKEHGVAEVIEEKMLTSDGLFFAVNTLLARKDMIRAQYARFAHPDVNREILETVISVARKGRQNVS
jgi:UDP-N-acetylglucosamine--N-acetylmuramyl-(pentapeptide) pyrophosphoryl-undecaprenol N-acetylglucosamine transferase